MTLLAIDAGTTHCKAGLFNESGRLLALASRATPQRQWRNQHRYDPDALWATTVAVVRDALQEAPAEPVAAVGISSMAESGLLLKPQHSAAATPFIPWFDRRTVPQAERIAANSDVRARFLETGQRPTFKCAVARLLWWQEQEPSVLEGAVWLSVADYLLYRLTGALHTDYSLAGRTYAFSLMEKDWDEAWLQSWGLAPGLFPEALPGGAVAGHVRRAAAAETGLPGGAAVTIAGHDHVCAAFAAGVTGGNTVFDSMGTAETLVGARRSRPLTETDYDSGFSFGHQAGGDGLYWMGGLSTAGGALDWMRRMVAEPPLAYDDLDALLRAIPDEPTGILFLPYLAGSGAPHSDDRMPAIFSGLRQEHGRAHLARAVLEGVTFELEWIRRAALRLPGVAMARIVAGGGGAGNSHWLQLKADISGLPVAILPVREATLVGAALLAGVAGGVYGNSREAARWTGTAGGRVIEPRPGRHEAYQPHFARYSALQEALRQAL